MIRYLPLYATALALAATPAAAQPREGELATFANRDTKDVQQRLECAAFDLDLKRSVERKHSGEKRRQPHSANCCVAERLRIRSEGKTEQDENGDSE